MHLIEKHYRFHKLLKKFFILSNLIVFMLSFFIIFPLGQAFKNLHYKCPLYSSIKIIDLSKISEKNLSFMNKINDYFIDEDKSKWNVENDCEFGLASAILCVFYSVILLFFSMFSVKNRMDKQILPIWAIYNTFQFVIVFTSAIKITNGFSLFCNNFIKQSIELKLTCRKCQFIRWKMFENKYLFDYLTICSVSIWLCVLLILFNQIIVIIRIKEIYFSKIKEKQKEEYLILKYSKLSKQKRIKHHLKHYALNESKL